MSIPSRRSKNAFGLAARAWLFAVPLWAAGCETSESPTGGETHFLEVCSADSDRCGDGLSCVCGVCTRSCTSGADCRGLPAAECVAPADAVTCADVAAYCDVTCNTDAECRSVSDSHRCVQNVCRSGTTGPNRGTGGSGGSGGQGGAGANECETGIVEPNQVLVIGDSFFGISHQVTAYLEQHARDSGVLAVGERYRDNSSTTDNALAMGGNGIANQYARGIAEADVDVVVMDGGGTDLLLASCAIPAGECPALSDAAAGAETLLAQMAANGVSHVVYAFYPDAVDATMREKMDALRLLIEPVCANSPTPCHWVDLRGPLAAPGTLSEDGLLPTPAGSAATAAVIWDVMARECIAQ